MDTTSDWFYTSIQQKRTLGMLASASEIRKSLEDLGLGSWESIEKGKYHVLHFQKKTIENYIKSKTFNLNHFIQKSTAKTMHI